MSEDLDPTAPEESSSSVKKMKRGLYRRGAQSTVHERRELHDRPVEASDHWDDTDAPLPEADIEEDPEQVLHDLHEGRVPGAPHDPLRDILEENQHARTAQYEREQGGGDHTVPLAHRLIKTLFVASAVFFLVSVGIAGWWFFFGKGQVSCQNIEFNIRGPLSTPSGKELVLYVGITNKNPVALQNAEISVEFPEGTRSPEDSSRYLTTQRETVGTLEIGESVRTDARAVLYGQEHEEFELVSAIDFGIEDSNATWHCERPQAITIATAAVTLAADGLEEISTGQELELEITAQSNSEVLVPNVRLVADYPFGFDYTSADPKPTTDEHVWDFGDMEPGSARTITIRGTVSGQGDEARSVKFALGEADVQDETELNTTMQTLEHIYLLTEPFLALDVELDRDPSPEIQVSLGERMEVEVAYRNNTDYALHNVEVESLLPGIIIDRRSVEVRDGFFRLADNTVLWTPQTEPELGMLEPGESGVLKFVFKTKKFQDVTNAEDPRITLDFDVRAQRVSEDIPVQQVLTAQSPRTIQFVTDVALAVDAVYGIGPFTNTGLHPPKADSETTYTLRWSLTNTTNTLQDVEVSGRLPVNVTWLATTHPDNERLIYNPVSRTVTWLAESVAPGVGYERAAREAYFQVSLLPSITQIGAEALLLEPTTITAVDDFTGSMIEQTSTETTTKLKNDPYFPQDFGRVRE